MIKGVSDSQSAKQVDVVTITANLPTKNYIFSHWSSSVSSTIFANKNAQSTTFVMPARDVTIVANYSIKNVKLNIIGGTFANGEVSDQFKLGSQVKIIADIPNDKAFDYWDADSVILGNKNAQITTVIVGEYSDTIIAYFKNISTENNKIKLISKNGSSTEYKPGSSDIISIAAKKSDNTITLKTSGLTYGED